MNFLNPYVEIYFRPEGSYSKLSIPFYKEIIWIFLKHLDNRLKMFQHRVNIVFVDSDSLTGNKRFASIYEYSLKVDMDEYQKQDNYTKKKTLLEIVHNAFLSLADENNWDKKIITDAYNKSLNDNYIFSYKTIFKISRDKKNKGRICISLNGNIATLNAEIANQESNETYEIKLLSTDEDNLSWYRTIKNFGWFDKSKFGLKFLKGQLWIIINTENMKQEMIINPMEKSKNQIDLYIKELLELPTPPISITPQQ